MRHRYVKGKRKGHSAEKKGRCKGPGAGMCLGSSRNTKARVAEAVTERGQSGWRGEEGVKRPHSHGNEPEFYSEGNRKP